MGFLRSLLTSLNAVAELQTEGAEVLGMAPGFPEWLQQRVVRFGQVSRTEIVTNVGGVEKSYCGVLIPIGVNSERGLVAAASDRSDFPDQIDQQLLSVAANNAATAFQNARLINELRTAQKALRDQEQELRDVIDTISAIVWTALPDGSNTYVNKRFVEYSGLSAEQTRIRVESGDSP
jgi:PAS domain-containing protein